MDAVRTLLFYSPDLMCCENCRRFHRGKFKKITNEVIRTVKNYYRNFTRRKSAAGLQIFVKHRSLYNKKDHYIF